MIGNPVRRGWVPEEQTIRNASCCRMWTTTGGYLYCRKASVSYTHRIPIHCTTTDSLSAYLPQRFENLPVRHRCPSSFGYTKAAVFSTQALFLDDSKRLRLLHYMKQVFMHSPIQFLKTIRLLSLSGNWIKLLFFIHDSEPTWNNMRINGTRHIQLRLLTAI